MFKAVADSWRAIGVNESPLLRDFAPGDRSWLRFIAGSLAAVGAVLVFVIVTALIGGIAFAAYLISGGDAAAIEAFLQEFATGDIEMTWGLAIGLVWFTAIFNGLIALLFVWIGSLITKKPIKYSFTLAKRWRWRQAIAGLVLFAALLGGLLAAEVALFGLEPELPMLALSANAGQAAVFVVAMLIGLFIAAGAEELLFRGWFLRHSAVTIRWTWLFLLINGLIFSAIHGDFDPNGFIARVVMGIAFCYMALRFGGIEFATGAHTANNLILVLFIAPLPTTIPEPQPLQAGLMAETVVLLVLLVAAAELALRVPALKRFAGPPVEPDDTLSARQVFS
jgi:membrane protease YdiL (CAAX protease family)